MTPAKTLLVQLSIWCLLMAACSEGEIAASDAGTAGSSAGAGSGGDTAGDGAHTGASGGGSGQGAADGGAADTDGSAAAQLYAGDTNTAALPKAGNPDGKCSQALPAEAKAVDVSSPSSVVGTGSAASCTHAALATAIAQGGVITFDCGAAAATISVTSTLALRTDMNTVIDGGNKITIDGGGSVRLLSWNSPGWNTNTNTLTLQHLVIANAKAIGTELIPEHPAPCSQGYKDGQGGGLFMRDGGLRAIDVTFLNNEAALLGPDTGGGALYMLGCQPAYIASCTFKGNKASNAAGMGSLFTTAFIYDSLFEDNSATGMGANNDDATMCSFLNADQHQVGSGGNGGAIYSDGAQRDMTLCGVQIRNNDSGAFGPALFFTSNDQSNKGTLSIRDGKVFNNIPGNPGWQWKPGIATNAATPEPIDSDIQP